MPDSLFWLLWLLGLGGFLLALFFFRENLRKSGFISRSLNLSLLLVRFAPIKLEQELSVEQLRQKISLMEQFYANLHTIRDIWWRVFLYGRPAFALEITLPAVGEEIAFYIAVPRKFKRAVEKAVQGIFPEAHVEESRDYNIFNPEGIAVASRPVASPNNFYPWKTYQKLEGDPLKEVTNVFTKLARVGEGAALQIIARPAAKRWQGKLKERARYLYEGKKEKDWLFKFIEGLEVLFSPPKSKEDVERKKQEKREKEEKERRLTPLEDEVVKTLEAKASKALFETNIRLMASAASEARAREILHGLEVAFSQFTDPNLAGFKIEPQQGRGLKNFIFNFSFRNFEETRKQVLSSEELTSIFHLPNVPVETPKLKILKAREAAPPADLPREGLLLGYNLFRGDKSDVRMLDDDRRRHLYVIGQTGTGKTAFLKNLIVQDIQEGKGVCFMDPHGDTVEEILGMVPRHRLQDVIYFNPGDVARPLGLNFLEYDPNFPEQKTFLVNELFGIFQKLYGAIPESMGPIFEQYFRNATMLVMDDPASGNTMLEISRVMSEKPFRDLKISRAKNIVVKNFWTQIAEKAGGEAELRNMVPYITSKFDVFLANEIMRPIIVQEKSAFNFREVMDSGKILLVNLSKGRLGDINSALIGLIIVGKLSIAALSRTDIADYEKRRDFYLYIDEFQNVTTDSIATILSEARKYRLNLIVAHQFTKQLQENIRNAVFGNVGSMAAFRIGAEDGEFLEKQFAPAFKAQDLLNIDNYNCYVKLLIRGQTSPPFSLKTYPPEKGEREVAEVIKEISRVKYGRPREEVEREIVEKHENPLF